MNEVPHHIFYATKQKSILQMTDKNILHITNTCIIIIIQIKIILIANEIVYTWGDMLMDKNIQYHFNQVL